MQKVTQLSSQAHWHGSHAMRLFYGVGRTRVYGSAAGEGRMKEFLKGLRLWLAIGVLPTAASFAQSGWYQQAPYPTGNWLFAVATPDSSTIVAVGERGIIVRSTDGGETWTRQDSGTSNHLNGVSFVDADTGIAVGTQG